MAEIVHLIRTTPLAFLSWWLGELKSLLPGWLTSGTDQARTTLILDVHAEGAVLRARRPKGSETIGQIEKGGETQDLLALTAHRYRRWPLMIRLAADLGMRKVVDLPLSARDDLANLLQFELDRLTPFNQDDVYFAWRVLETNQAAGRMEVALEMAPKMLVDQAVANVAVHGRAVDRVEIDGSDQHAPLNLLSPDAKAESGGRIRRLLPALVLLLGIIAVWIPIHRQNQAIARLDTEIARVKSAADGALALRAELDAEAAEAGFLAEAKNSRASMTQLLAELTRLVPDDSYIIQLEIKEGTIQISGFADRASDLITILDQSAVFTSPTFQSAVTRNRRRGKERFQIAIDVAESSS